MIRGIPFDPTPITAEVGDYKPLRAVFVRISLELLRELLKYPKDTRIVSIFDEGYPDEVTLRVEGDGLPEGFTLMPDCKIPHVQPKYKLEYVGEKITMESWR